MTLPGTFAVEKGVFRFLLEKDRDDPLSPLDWPFESNSRVVELRRAAHTLVKRDDYRSLSRVFAVQKLLHIADDETDSLFSLVVDFIGPFLLRADGPGSVQWPKLQSAFKLVRHLAYLTLDTPYSGLQWAPNVPALLRHAISDDNASLFTVDTSISEILSPLEKAIYDSIYHHPDARREVAIISARVTAHLRSSADPISTIKRWLNSGLFRELKIGRRPRPTELKRIATVRMRSHFLMLQKTPAILESDLAARGFSDPIVFEYEAWNAETLLEPDELLIDFFSRTNITACDIGNVILWVINEFEELAVPVDDVYELLRKNQLEQVYVHLVSRAIQLQNPSFEVRIVPWRLQDFGLFRDVDLRNQGAVWASRADLSSPLVTYILRDRSRYLQPDVRERYAELIGLRQLRRWLRKRSKGRDLRCRWLVVTGSVQLWQGTKSIIEFDGAILQVSARSGSLKIFAVESKTGHSSAIQSLRRRVSALGLPGEIYPLSQDHAVLEILL